MALLACVLALLAPSALAQMIAKVETVEGVVAVQKRTGPQKVAGAGTELMTGDIVSTAKNSTALLVFTDQTQVAMRPESRLVVSDYTFRQGEPQADSMVMHLVKGGARTLTGLIGKRGNPDAVRVAAAGTTVGVRGVDFIARVCQEDCGPEQRGREAVRQPQVSASGAVGRVASINGRVTATLAGNVRTLEVQKPVFLGDVLESVEGSAALIVFNDNTQFLLKQKTKATIAAFNHDRERPEQNRMAVEMSSGGARFNSGNTARLAPQNVQIIAPQAVIGIRGTGFHLACAPANAHSDAGAAAAGTTACSGAFYVRVTEGRVYIRAGGVDREFTAGQTAYVSAQGQPATQIAATPSVLAGESVTDPATTGAASTAAATPDPAGAPPPPQSTDSPPATTSSSGTLSTAAVALLRGLIIASNEGQVVLTSGREETVIARGEAGVVSSATSPVTHLSVAPVFLDADPFLARIRFLDQTCFD